MESWIVSNVSLTHISSFNQTSDRRCTLTSKTAWSVTLWELSEGFGPVYFLENPTDDQTDSPFKDAPALKYPLFCGLWISSTSQRFSSRFGLKLRASESGRDLNGGVHLEIRHTEDHLKTVSRKNNHFKSPNSWRHWRAKFELPAPWPRWTSNGAPSAWRPGPLWMSSSWTNKLIANKNNTIKDSKKNR